MPQPVKPFHYRLKPTYYGVCPGVHPGQTLGDGQTFKYYEPLIARPDPRRIDLRASFLDPFECYRIKAYQQSAKSSVLVIADLSASMHDAGKLQFICHFILAAAQSAFASGDRFCFTACGCSDANRWQLRNCVSIQPVLDLAEQLVTKQASRRPGEYVDIVALAPQQRSLIFLVSDFHFPLNRCRELLLPISSHAVVPMVLWQAAEYLALPEWGLHRFIDAENSRCKTLFLRPSLKKRIVESFAIRKSLLEQTFRSFGMEALFLNEVYKAETLTNYFLRRAL